MAEPRYTVAFDGSVRPDRDPEQVKAQLTAALKLRPDHIDKLFSGQLITVKANLLYAQALRLQAVFDEAGALCQLVREHDAPSVAPGPTVAGTASPTAAASVPDVPAPQSGEAPIEADAGAPATAPAAAESMHLSNPASAQDPPEGSLSQPTGHAAADSAPGADIVQATAPTVPPAPTASHSPHLHLSPGDIAGLFTGKPRRMPPTTVYRLGIIGAALVTVLMLLVYGLLVALVGYATLRHALDGLLLMEQETLIGVLFAYFLPLVLGVVAFVFLIKPMVARVVPPPQRLELDPLREPVLFALVQHVADLVGAPRPERLYVDCSVNASAGFSRVLPPFGAALALTVGMPLFAGMSTRQVVGVLGHELGHLAQHADMRATYLIRMVNQWFHRAVHERDAWDARLHALCEHRLKWVAAIFAAVEGAVGLQRKLLSGLNWLSHVISQPMLRQMEFDADRYEAQLAGSENFRDTTQRLILLMQAYDDVHGELATGAQGRPLPEDLPGLIAQRADELAPLSRGKIEARVDEADTSVFAAHPPDDERIARAEQLAAPALFVLDAPAAEMLKKYDKLARQTTDGFYRGTLGISPTREQPGAAQVIRAATEQSRQQDTALSEYCGELFVPFRFLAPADWHGFEALSPEQRRERLDELVTRLRAAMPDISGHLTTYQHLNEQAMLAYCDQVFREAGMSLEPQTEEHRSLAALKDERLSLDGTLHRHETVLAERMAIALGGLIQEAGEHSEVGREIARLMAAQGQLTDLAGTYNEFYGELNVLTRLTERLSGQTQDEGQAPPVSDTLITSHLDALVEHLDRIKGLLNKVSYPFSHAGGEVSVFAQLKEGLPELHPKQVESVLEYSRALFDALPNLHRRVFGRLAQLAGGYERGMGVMPLRAVGTKTDDAPLAVSTDAVLSDEA